jgi:RND family efflux transporter MFP subunit
MLPSFAYSWPVMAASAALMLAACGKPAPAPEPVRAVKVLAIGATPGRTELAFSAEVRAQVESRLGFRVAGKIMQRQAELGQRVQAGQMLAQLDPQDYQLADAAARAQVAAAITQRDLAAADFKRFAALRDQNFISGAELERRESALQAAQAQLDQAQAQQRAQSNQATYTRLLAPAAGVITAVEADPGQVVAAGATVVRLAQDGARDAVFSVPEDKLSAMPVGAEVQVLAWSDSRTVVGRVREVAASADPVTRTYQVKAALPAAAGLPLGATVTAQPKAQATPASAVIKLPLTALRQEGGGSAVWLLDPASMTVSSRAVQIGAADGNEVVVTSGLSAGMQVVVTGVHVLAPGQKVSLYTAAR